MLPHNHSHAVRSLAQFAAHRESQYIELIQSFLDDLFSVFVSSLALSRSHTLSHSSCVVDIRPWQRPHSRARCLVSQSGCTRSHLSVRRAPCQDAHCLQPCPHAGSGVCHQLQVSAACIYPLPSVACVTQASASGMDILRALLASILINYY